MGEISTFLQVVIDIWDKSSDGFREELGSRLRRVADRIAEFSIKATSYIHPWLMEVTLFVLQYLERDVLAVSAADCIEALKGTAFGEKEIECLVVAKHTSEAVAKAMTNLNSLRNSVVGSHLAGIQADNQQVQNVADGLVAFCDVTVCLNKCITANDSNDATSLELLGKLDGAVSELKKSPGTGRSSANLRQLFSHISAALLAGPEQYLHMKIHATHPKVEKEFKEKLLLNSFPADHDQFDLPLDSVDALKKYQAFPANTSAKVEQFVKLCESAFGDHWRAQLAQCHAKMDLAQRALVVYKLKRLELPDASLLACNDKLDFEDELFDASLDVKAKMESFIEICKLVKNDFSNASAASLSKKTTAKMSLKGAGKGPKPGSGTQVAAEKNEKGEGDGSGKEVAEEKDEKSEDKKGDGDGSGKEVAEEEGKNGKGDGSGVAEEPPEDAEVKATGAEESKEAKDGDGKDTSDAHEIVEDDVVEFTLASHLDNALELCPMMLNHLLNHWTNTCKAICSITSPLHPPREEWEVFALRAVNGDKIKGYASDEKFLSIGKWGKKCDSYLAHIRKKCQESSDLQLRNWWDMAGVKGSHKKACNHVKEAKLALAVIHTANKIHVKKKITEKEKKKK